MNLHTDKVGDFLDRCFSAGIKDPVSFLLSKRPQVYDWLKGVFPRGILPTDIDGEVELNGHFLRLEFKHEDALRSGRIPKGQRIALSVLAKEKGFTVFIIGTNEHGEPTCIEMMGPKGISRVREVNRSQVRDLCSQWAKSTEHKPTQEAAC